MELMLGKPRYGWSKVNLGNFECSVSYLNDIPFDWLKALKIAIENDTVATLFGDCEGWDFYIVLDTYYGFVIENKNELQAINIDYGLYDFAMELCDNIRVNLEDWAVFCDYEDYNEEDKERRKYELLELIAGVQEGVKNARRNNN